MPVSHGHDSGKVGIKVTSAGARTGMGLIQDAHNCGGRACRQGVMARFAIGCLELLMEMQQVRYFVALAGRSEEHTSELQSLMRISYAVFCLKKKKQKQNIYSNNPLHYH